jgi:hypothetical protein
MKVDRKEVEKALELCKKNKQLFDKIGISKFESIAEELEKTLFAIELEDKYGIIGVKKNMVHGYGDNIYVEINDYLYIASMGKKYSRIVAWSVDGKQPENENLFVVDFPTGPYVLGDDYPIELFQKMWDEIKSYKHKYRDDHNKCIYFTLENAAPVANAFAGILQKYYEIYRSESNEKRVQFLKDEISRIEKMEVNA